MIGFRTRKRRTRDLPEFAGHKSQADRRKDRLGRLDEIRNRWWKEGRRTCGICRKQISARANYTLDHISPGTAKSDAESNLQPAHYDCNIEKGSRRNFTK